MLVVRTRARRLAESRWAEVEAALAEDAADVPGLFASVAVIPRGTPPQPRPESDEPAADARL